MGPAGRRCDVMAERPEGDTGDPAQALSAQTSPLEVWHGVATSPCCLAQSLFTNKAGSNSQQRGQELESASDFAYHFLNPIALEQRASLAWEGELSCACSRTSERGQVKERNGRWSGGKRGYYLAKPAEGFLPL